MHLHRAGGDTRQLADLHVGLAVLDEDCQIYGNWIPGEGRAGLEAALAGGVRTGAGEGKIVPFSVPNLQISANENATASSSN